MAGSSRPESAVADGVEGSAVAFSWFRVEHRSMLDCPENSRPPPISLSHRGVIPTGVRRGGRSGGSAVAFSSFRVEHRSMLDCGCCLQPAKDFISSFPGVSTRCRVVALTRPDSSWRLHVEQRRCAGRRVLASRSRASRRARPLGKTVIRRVRASCSSHRRRTQQAASEAAKRTAV